MLHKRRSDLSPNTPREGPTVLLLRRILCSSGVAMNGFWERVFFAFRCFLSILFHAEIPSDIARKLVRAPEPVPQAPVAAGPSVTRPKEAEPPAPETSDRAVQMLALLQRDGRLIDFLAENISAYPDTQLGAAVAPSTRLAGRCSIIM